MYYYTSYVVLLVVYISQLNFSLGSHFEAYNQLHWPTDEICIVFRDLLLVRQSRRRIASINQLPIGSCNSLILFRASWRRIGFK